MYFVYSTVYMPIPVSQFIPPLLHTEFEMVNYIMNFHYTVMEIHFEKCVTYVTK